MKTAFLVLLVPAVCAAQTPKIAPPNAQARAAIASAAEPGVPMTIRGIVYDEDGRTPLRSASVYVYQTDTRGSYAPNDARASDAPRLKGYLRTDEKGRFEYTTIRPGSYPGSRNPGHIHYHVSTPAHREYVFEIVFEDDPLIPAQWRQEAQRAGSPVAIVKLRRDRDGRLHGEHEIKLRRKD
jgi:protocatechuate 3,4-dioxygenase beta subunit